MSAKEKIDWLMAHHDDDVASSVAQLSDLEPSDVETADLRRLSWLINHVVGELSDRWPDALALQQSMARHDEPPQAAWNRSVAAALAGSPLDAWNAERAFASVAGCSPDAARIALRFAVLQFLAGRIELAALIRELLVCEQQLAALDHFGGLERYLAPALNNLVSALIERADAAIDDESFQTAVTVGADLAYEAWSLAGNWVNRERADYLRALTFNLLGRWQDAHHAATRALMLIEENGSEDVDRAFLLLELGRAQRGLGDASAAGRSRSDAVQLAALFNDASLSGWFDDRVRIANADHA